jgi:hypothetical protein
MGYRDLGTGRAAECTAAERTVSQSTTDSVREPFAFSLPPRHRSQA